MRTLVAIALVVGVVGADRVVAAEPLLPPRVIHAPVGRLLPRGAIHGTAGANHRKGGMAAFTVGLADIAELELGVSDELVTCDPCGDRATRVHAFPLVAGFKLGVNQGTWFRGQPAVALGFRKTAGGRPVPWGDDPGTIAQLYLAASAAVGGGVRVHGGAALWASRHRDPEGGVVELAAAADTIRPFAAVEFTPSFYPRTTLLGDVAYTPELEPHASKLRWIGGWGVRYQALSWGSIELEVRHRQGDGLAGSTVLVRINGSLQL